MRQEYVGIYLGINGTSVVSFKGKRDKPERGLFKVIPVPPGVPPIEQLKRLLGTLQPTRKRRIAIVLPRRYFFIREIPLENLSPSEAVASVKMSISLHSHLPEEDIFFDVEVFQRDGKTVVLLVYLPRERLSPVIEALKEAGHLKSLHSVIPLGVSLDTVSRELNAPEPPYICLLKDDKDQIILSLHGKETWEGSHPVHQNPGEELLEAVERMRGLLPPPMNDRKMAPLYTALDLDLKESQPHPVFSQIKRFIGNKWGNNVWHAACAALTATAFPPVSMHGPRRRPIRFKVKAFHMAVAASVAGMLFLSIPLSSHYVRLKKEVRRLEVRVNKAEQALVPLKDKVKQVEAVKSQAEEMEEFLKNYPPILDVLEELANLTPEDAWIRTFNLSGDTIRLSAEGPNALAIMSEWRKSRYFEKVRLISPVTRPRNGGERFSVEIRLKKQG